MRTDRSSQIQQLYEQTFPISAAHSAEACQVFPDGVTHDSRHLLPFAVSVSHGLGPHKWSVEGKRLTDYWMGHGSLMLGHSHPVMVEAVQKQVAKSTHPGASHELEIEWGKAVQRLIPSAEKVRFVSSGTEATLMALRVSRIVTGRSKVMKLAGHFHGWHDGLIPGADAPHGGLYSEFPGIPAGTRADLVIVPPNDLSLLEQAFEEHHPACLILEPTGGHWGQVPLSVDYLREVRRLTAERKILLIFDEVITGFRVSPGGAQTQFSISPDLTTLAKVLAGGLPGGCLAGKSEFMEALQSQNRYQQKMKHPGTYNGNPLSAAAGIAVLNEIATGKHCQQANEMGRLFREKLNTLFQQKRVNWIAYGSFSMLAIQPEYEGPPATTDDFVPYQGSLEKLDRKFDPRFTHAFRCALLSQGVDFFGWRAMLSSTHTPSDIEQTCQGVSQAIDLLRADQWIS